MPLFKRKPVPPGLQPLPEPRLEAAAVEHAIAMQNCNVAAGGDIFAFDTVWDAARERLREIAKTEDEHLLMQQRAAFLRGNMKKNRFCTLYARFDIDKTEMEYGTSAYGDACYRVIFRSVPHRRLFGCMFFAGDSRATLRGREDVFIVGFGAALPQLELIEQSMSKSMEFKKVCAQDPLQLRRENPFQCDEPLVRDGTMLADGVKETDETSSCAKSAYDSLKRSGEI